jgi:hypothetical protein
VATVDEGGVRQLGQSFVQRPEHVSRRALEEPTAARGKQRITREYNVLSDVRDRSAGVAWYVQRPESKGGNLEFITVTQEASLTGNTPTVGYMAKHREARV